MVHALTRFLLVLAAAVCLVAPLRADDDAVRDKVLELNKLTGTDPIEGEIKVLTGDAEGTKKMLAVAVKLTKDKDRPLNFNASYILGRAASDLKDTESAIVLYRYAAEEARKLQSSQKILQSFGSLIDLLYDAKKFDETVKLCKEFMEIDGNETVQRMKLLVLERMIQALARQKNFKEALKTVDDLVEREGDDGWAALQLKGWVLREADRTDDAVKALETVVERIKADKSLKKEIKDRYLERNRYFLSSLYIDQKQVDKAADQLKILLEQKPDDPTYNNDLGYIWADHDMNLDEAEKMIRKALEEDRKQRKADPDFKPEDDKDNAAYLDSLGWVLYKQKKYKEAKEWLQKAVKDKEGQHIEIFDHLGDVLKALGERDEAVAAWKKGIESVEKKGPDVTPPTKRELDRKKEVEKKIKENQ